MEISQSNTRKQFPLSYKKPLKKTIGASVGLVFFVVFFALAAGLSLAAIPTSGLPMGVTLVSAVILFCLVIILLDYWYQVMYFKTYYYDFTEHFIIIRKGVIAPREITIPYERVQDIYIDQDVLDRMFGLYDVHLSSATSTSGFEAHIDGLEQPAAEGLKTVLLDVVRTRVTIAGSTPIPTQPQSNTTTVLP